MSKRVRISEALGGLSASISGNSLARSKTSSQSLKPRLELIVKKAAAERALLAMDLAAATLLELEQILERQELLRQQQHEAATKAMEQPATNKFT